MCGIAGIYVKERGRGRLPLNRLYDALMLGCERRGRDATGFVSVGFDGSITLDKDALTASTYIHTRRDISEDSRIVLGHTRYQTKGDYNKMENNHPVTWGTCFATHNGHISNDDNVLEEANVPIRPAEVDSIAIPVILNHCGMDNMDNLKTALEQLEGNMAVAAIDPIKHPNRLVLAKGKSSPLYILNHPRCIIWASERLFIDAAWSAVIGTPPEFKSFYPVPSDKNTHGWYDLGAGDLWVVEDDNVEVDKFTVKYRSINYAAQGYGWSGDGFHNHMSNVQKYPNWDKELRQRYRETYRYTCSPSSVTCDHKCDVGCMASTCTCREYIRDYEPSYTSGKVKELPVHTGTEIPDEEDDVLVIPGDDWDYLQNGEGHVRCNGCYDWFTQNLLKSFDVANVTWILCEDCETDDWFKGMVGEGTPLAVPVSETDNDFVELSGEEVEELNSASQQAKWDARRAQYDREHESACRKISDEYDTTPEYVEWLLFEAEMAVLEADEQLAADREKFDWMYADLTER